SAARAKARASQHSARAGPEAEASDVVLKGSIVGADAERPEPARTTALPGQLGFSVARAPEKPRPSGSERARPTDFPSALGSSVPGPCGRPGPSGSEHGRATDFPSALGFSVPR